MFDIMEGQSTTKIHEKIAVQKKICIAESTDIPSTIYKSGYSSQLLVITSD